MSNLQTRHQAKSNNNPLWLSLYIFFYHFPFSHLYVFPYLSAVFLFLLRICSHSISYFVLRMFIVSVVFLNHDLLWINHHSLCDLKAVLTIALLFSGVLCFILLLRIIRHSFPSNKRANRHPTLFSPFLSSCPVISNCTCISLYISIFPGFLNMYSHCSFFRIQAYLHVSFKIAA